MWSQLWPILVVVGANTFYNICAKSTPGEVQPFASLTLTYLTATILSLGLFYATSPQKDLIQEIHRVNWTSFVLGAAIVALEFGYIYVYRSGWKVNTGSLVANLALAMVLLVVGFALYGEAVTLKQGLGLLLSVGGLILISA